MNFECWILDSFRVFMGFEISKNFSYVDGESYGYGVFSL